jgi:chain length determinant protein (polysaccharide antigen chain regulator)
MIDDKNNIVNPRSGTYSKINNKSFLDVVAQMWRGKYIIIFSVFLMAVAAFSYQATLKRTWTSSVIISSPSQADLAKYESIASSIESADEKNIIASREFQRIVFATFKSYLSVISVPHDMKLAIKTTETGLVEVKLSSFSAEYSYAELNKIIKQANESAASYYINDLETKINAEKDRLNDLISAQENALKFKTKRRLLLLENAQKIAINAGIKENQLKYVDNIPDDLLYMLGSINLGAMIDVLKQNPQAYDENLYANTFALAIIQNYDLKSDDMKSMFIVKEPAIPVHADHNQKLVYIILAAMFGFGLGVIIVLIRDFVISFYRKK